jgi:DNA-binding NarL/FixJ family response regulator
MDLALLSDPFGSGTGKLTVSDDFANKVSPTGLKRVLLADDHTAMLEEVRELLGDRYEVVGIVADGGALVEAAHRLQPDLIISDISMPVMTGFQAAAAIRKSGLSCKLIFLTVQSSPAYLKKARALGADGYVLKVYSGEQLTTAVSQVLAGQSYISPQLQSEWK